MEILRQYTRTWAGAKSLCHKYSQTAGNLCGPALYIKRFSICRQEVVLNWSTYQSLVSLRVSLSHYISTRMYYKLPTGITSCVTTPIILI